MKVFEFLHFDARFEELRDLINSLKELVTVKNDELATTLGNVSQQLAKANGEIQDKLAALQAAVDAADNVPQAVIDALAPLQTAAQQLDDIVPDSPTP